VLKGICQACHSKKYVMVRFYIVLRKCNSDLQYMWLFQKKEHHIMVLYDFSFDKNSMLTLWIVKDS